MYKRQDVEIWSFSHCELGMGRCHVPQDGFSDFQFNLCYVVLHSWLNKLIHIDFLQSCIQAAFGGEAVV